MISTYILYLTGDGQVCAYCKQKECGPNNKRKMEQQQFFMSNAEVEIEKKE
jgi:hypothetical protein